MSETPLVTIGLPVYNGERFLRETLEALLAQDFQDYELLISDNASTDGTEKIAREFAGRDGRVSYSRNTENVGSVRNFGLLLERGRGKYFIWASTHDRWDARLLGQCVAALEAEPEAVLCYSQSYALGEDGRIIGPMPQQRGTVGLSRLDRYNMMIWHLDCSVIYGLHRLSALRQMPPMGRILGPDDVRLGELALLGPFVCLPERLFYFRVMNQTGNIRDYMRRQNLPLTWWNPPLLVLDHLRQRFASIRRHVPSRFDRIPLILSTLARTAKLLVGFTAGTWATMLCPRLWARINQALLRRQAVRAGKEST